MTFQEIIFCVTRVICCFSKLFEFYFSAIRNCATMHKLNRYQISKSFAYQLHLEKYQAYEWWSTFKVAGVSCKLNFQSARDQGIYVHNSLCQFYLTFVQHSTVQSQPYFCFIVRMNEQSKTFVAFVLYGKKKLFFGHVAISVLVKSARMDC